MSTIISDFESRVKEIEVYFRFLEDILVSNGIIYFAHKKSHKKKAFDNELTKILRANGFLLLYNLVESSTKKAIEEIYSSLNNENANYKNVREEIKKKWIELKYKNFKPDTYVSQSILQCISNIEMDVIAMPTNVKERFSGNIDSRKIRDYSAMYGFSAKTHHSTKNGEKLFIVKNKRNDLAHGIVSFCDCGKDYAIEDLLEIKKQVINYLRGILKNVDTYIQNKEFLITP